ncbi:MAG: hypothetical protein WC496_00770 [Phycisphaerae bacterium]|jgi:tetratricopeptide (TPR) repeat protein
MKSERRHELATNELADWIANFPQWYKENLTTIVVGAIVVVALIAYTIFFYHRETRVLDQKESQTTAMLDQLRWQKQTILQGKQQGLGVSDIFLNTASGLENAAAEVQNDVLSALAMIKRAEALRTELHYRLQVAEPDVQKYQIGQAMKIYEEALVKAKADATVSAMAEYGIALCLEDMGEFAGARGLYSKIAQAPEYKGTLYSARAQLRADTLSDNEGKVVFVKSEKPEPGQAETKPVERLPAGKLSLEAPIADNNLISGNKSDSNLAR